MVIALYAATALLLLLLTHRYVLPLSRAAMLVLVVLPLGITGYALVSGGVYGPIDHPYASEPLAALKPLYGIGAPHNPSAADVYGSMFPWRKSVQASLERGEWPLLNPYMLAHHLLAAAAQAAPYSPFTLIACLLPAAVSFTYTAAIAMFIAALGAFLLARELKCSELPALIAAAGWAYASSTVVYVHTAMGFALVFEPLILLGALRVVRRPGIASGALLAAVLALVVLAGHPETLFLAVLAGSALALFELVRRRENPLRAMATAVAAGVVALLICAIHLLPFFEAMEQSAELHVKRTYWTERPDVPRERILAAIATDFFPFLHVRRWVKPDLGLTQVETAACGSIVLALAVYAVWRRRSAMTWFFLAVAVICVAVETRVPVAVAAIRKIPLMGITHEERLAYTAALSLVMLAALGADELLRRRDRRGAAITFTAVLIVLAAGTWWLSRNVVLAVTFHDWGDYKIFAELFCLGAAALLFAFRAPMRVAAPALLALLVTQRVLSEGGTFKTFPAEAAYPPLPIFEPLKHVRGPFRVTGQYFALLPGTNAFYGLEEVRGFEALHYLPFVKTWPMWSTFQPIWFNRVDDITRPFVSFLNVKYAVVSDTTPLPDGWREAARMRGSALFENTRALERAFVPRRVKLGLPLEKQLEEMSAQTDFADTAWLTAPVAPYERDNGPGRVRIVEYSPGGRYVLDVEMERNGWVVVSDTAWKGWRAYVDGRRVEMQHANAAFNSVHVPAGRHFVRLVYWPESFVIGRAISFATLLAIAAFAFGRRWSRQA